MKLYYSPGACSLSPHIVAHEAGIDLATEKVDLRAKKTESGRDFWAINPKGYVPALELEGGEVLTEGTAIIQYLADQKPEAKLLPAAGTLARYRVLEAIGYINSELHKSYGPLFNPQLPAEARQQSEEYLRKRYALLDKQLAAGPFLFGEQFTVADAYLFTVTSWAEFLKFDISAFPNVLAFLGRAAARPGVRAALAAEGLLKG